MDCLDVELRNVVFFEACRYGEISLCIATAALMIACSLQGVQMKDRRSLVAVRSLFEIPKHFDNSSCEVDI